MTLQSQVKALLSDQKWHCRAHEYGSIPSGQLAGGGGIQGLKRGTKNRPGLIIESENKACSVCRKMTRHDRWTGAERSSQPAGNIPAALMARILVHYNSEEPIGRRVLRPNQITVDHRIPRIRWGADYVPPEDSSISSADIQRHFQLLENTPEHNENLRKSRACERCLATGERQSPISDIDFFYAGTNRWPAHLNQHGADAEKGCNGCGWYDTLTWLEAIDAKV
jgi:hypothetical protein